MAMLKVFKSWRFFVLIIIPILLLPIPISLEDDGADSKKFHCAYVILLMGIFWVTEAMPLPITALLPVVLFSFLGIQSTGNVAANYMTETAMMFIGTITLALGIQLSGLHKRIALKIMILIGTSPWRLLLGILVTTMLLSCFIVNTAVTAMMIPIISGLIESLEDLETESRRKSLRKLYLLAVCYSANIGGTATLIGSNPNLIFNELISKKNIGQNGKYMDVNFVSWFAFNFPTALINLFVTWILLGSLYLGHKLPCTLKRNRTPSLNTIEFDNSTSTNNDFEDIENSSTKINLVMRGKLSELGSTTFHELGIIILFSIGVILWVLRNPRIFNGWLSLFDSSEISIGDSSVAIGIVILMFIIPNDVKYFTGDFSEKPETLMNWKYIHENFPWSVILLTGGGLAISDGATKSGFSLWIGDKLNGLEALPSPVILIILLLFISCFTEIASNSATISLLTPILLALSKELNIHPLYLTLPGAVACQFAFMLPSSNPSNALVYTAGDMKILDMVKAGVLLNMSCLVVLFLMNISWGEYVIFSYKNYEYPIA